MSNEISFTSMKEYLKTFGKFLFWNFLSALAAIALLHFILWVENLTGKQNVLAGCLEVPSHVWGAWGMFGYVIGALLFLLIFGLLVLIFCACMRCVSLCFDPSFNKRGAINTKHLLVFDLVAYFCSYIAVFMLWWMFVSFEEYDMHIILGIILFPLVVRFILRLKWYLLQKKPDALELRVSGFRFLWVCDHRIFDEKIVGRYFCLTF